RLPRGRQPARGHDVDGLFAEREDPRRGRCLQPGLGGAAVRGQPEGEHQPAGLEGRSRRAAARNDRSVQRAVEDSVTVLVTGGGRGIGAATARLAAERGYTVCVNYRSNRAAADGVVAEIESRGGTAIAVGADVSKETDFLRLFQTIDERVGPLRALVNNAGVLETQTRVDSIDAARLGRVFATNVTGAFLCA